MYKKREAHSSTSEPVGQAWYSAQYDKVNNIISSSANPYFDIFGISDPRPMQVDLQDMLRKTGTNSPTF